MSRYGEIIQSFSEWIIDRTGAQTMLYLTYTMISNVDLARFMLSHAKDMSIWRLRHKSHCNTGH